MQIQSPNIEVHQPSEKIEDIQILCALRYCKVSK